VVLDVTSAITGQGEVTFGIDTTSSTNINMSSRESGPFSPYLVLDLFTYFPDNTPPTSPTGLSLNPVSITQVDISWNAATDNVDVAGYTIYRDGVAINSVLSPSLTYSDTSVTPNTEYSYSLDAFDQAGNYSAISEIVTVTTPDLPNEVTVLPVADSYVNASKPTSNYGSATNLRADASPDLHSFIRFNVQNLYGKSISQAQLLVYANSRSSVGINALSVSDNNWIENTLNFNNAPQLGEILSTSGSITAGTWLTFDVSSYISGEGIYSFGLTTLDTSNINLSSKESGVYAPRLILNLYTFVPDTTPPSTPTGLIATPVSPTQVDLLWNESTDDVGVIEYRIYRDGLNIASVSGTTLAFSDTTVSPLSSYTYSVDAVDNAGNYSSKSTDVVVVTNENEPPSTPEGLSAEVIGPNLVRLSWNASMDNVGVTGYSLYRDGILLVVVGNNSLMVEDATVNNGGIYTYSVVAFDQAGNNSQQSSPVEVTINYIDTEAPSVPTNLSASTSNPTEVVLSWNASTDNVGVSGYSIYRDALLLATVDGLTLSFTDSTVTPNTQFTYTVDAFDASGNHSGVSNNAVITTLDLPSSLTFSPTADAYINESTPDTNYGSSPFLRVDASPVLNSYLKFTVAGLFDRTITRVRLLVYANSSSSQVLHALAVADNSWTEGTLTYNNAPLIGSLLGASTPAIGGTWMELDITGSINSEGEFTFGVTTPGLTAIGLASRENIDFAPRLIIDLD
jgi:chitodextrinase